MADDERLIETRDPSFWNPCADSEWAYVGVPLSRCEAVGGPREVKKIDCTGLLSESVQALFQEIVDAFVEGEEYRGVEPAKLLRKRAAETINNLVYLGSGERPSFLMRDMRWLVAIGTCRLSPCSPRRSFTVQFDDREESVAELVKCLEESNRQHDKALLYILLGKWIFALKCHLRVARVLWPSEMSVVNNKLQCATRQRALLSCFHAFDAGAEDWYFGGHFPRAEPLRLFSLDGILFGFGGFKHTENVSQQKRVSWTRFNVQ